MTKQVIKRLKKEINDVFRELEDVIEVSYIALAQMNYAVMYEQTVVAELITEEITKTFKIPWYVPSWVITTVVNNLIIKVKSKSGAKRKLAKIEDESFRQEAD